MKRALLTAFLAVALVGAAQAQSQLGNAAFNPNVQTAPADVQIWTTIVSPISVNVTGAIDFGIVQHDQGGSTSNIDPLNAGSIEVSAFPGSTIDVSDNGEVTLTGGNGDGSVTFTPATSNTAQDISIPTGTGASETRVVTGLTGTLDISGTAFGGFSGNYTLTFDYTSI